MSRARSVKDVLRPHLWFPPVDVRLGAGQVGRTPVLVMGYSRQLDAVILPSRKAPDLLRGRWL
jgi:hypothetical protein